MKTSIICASLFFAGVALSKPIEARDYFTEWDIDTVTVTVTGAPDGFSWPNWGNWGGWHPQTTAAAAATTTTEAPAPTWSMPSWTTEAPAATSTTAEAATGWGSSSGWSSAAPSSTASSSYGQAILDQHNNHRANASVPALTWSDDMASIAQQIAASCVYAHNTEAGGGGYGQNIGAGAEPSAVPALITNEMYNNEIGWYPLPYGVASPDMTNFEHWGHYSQIVWKSTTSVGCYTQYCPNGLANTGSDVSPYFTVCNYSPPGNYGGEYGANVLPPSQDEPTVNL